MIKQALTVHIVRRGVERLKDFKPSPVGQPLDAEHLQAILRRLFTSGWSAVAIWSTIVGFMVLALSLSYITWLTTTLAAVETSQPQSSPMDTDKSAGTLPKAATTSEKESLLDVEAVPQFPVFPAKLVTKKICSTLKHIRRTEGVRGYFRGLKTYAIYSVLHSVLLVFFTFFLFQLFPAGQYVAKALVSVLMCRLHCAWTHAIIRTSSGSDNDNGEQDTTKAHRGRCSVRYVSREDSRRLILPTLRLSLCSVAAEVGLTKSLELCEAVLGTKGSTMSPGVILSVGFLPLFVGLAAFFGLVLPAWIALVRVEASLLPETDATIVPLDRSFEGRVVPAGEQSRLQQMVSLVSIRAAWKTFPFSTYRRVSRAIVKLNFLSFALQCAFVALLAYEVVAFAGKDLAPYFEWAMEEYRKEVQRQMHQ